MSEYSGAQDPRQRLADEMSIDLLEEQLRAEEFSEAARLSTPEADRVLELAMKQASRTPGSGEPVVDDSTLLDFYATRLTNYTMSVKAWRHLHPNEPFPREYLSLSKLLDTEQQEIKEE